jgi:hypothetical protein
MFNTKKVATSSTQENLFEIARKIDRIVFDDILELNEEDKMLIIEHLEIMTRFAKTQTKD